MICFLSLAVCSRCYNRISLLVAGEEKGSQCALSKQLPWDEIGSGSVDMQHLLHSKSSEGKAVIFFCGLTLHQKAKPYSVKGLYIV